MLERTNYYSFYKDNVHPLVVLRQRQVFDKFGINLTQIEFKGAHWQAIDAVLNSDDWDYAIVCDVDCIPLSEDVFESVYMPALRAGCLVGPMQRSGDKGIIYASPCALGISSKLYNELGRPSSATTPSLDCSARISEQCYRKHKPMLLLPVSDCVIPKWKLTGDWLEFGVGTTYAGMIYHQYEIRYKQNQPMFIGKCDDVLNCVVSSNP